MPNIPRLIHKAHSGAAPVFEPSAGTRGNRPAPQIGAISGKLVTGVLRVLQESAVNDGAVIGQTGGFHGA